MRSDLQIGVWAALACLLGAPAGAEGLSKATESTAKHLERPHKGSRAGRVVSVWGHGHDVLKARAGGAHGKALAGVASGRTAPDPGDDDGGGGGGGILIPAE
jgi:hypothetical protein